MSQFLNYHLDMWFLDIKFFFKVATKIVKKLWQKVFFDPSKNEKPSVQKVPLYRIYWDFLHLKFICTHQAHSNPRKPYFYFNKIGFWRVLMCLVGANKFYIAELFGPRVFRFSMGQKKSFVTTFWRFLCRP